jgi:hypothetical protein
MIASVFVVREVVTVGGEVDDGGGDGGKELCRRLLQL